ncbi:MAG: nuclear transport factor 2 family protein [Reyranella sp.]|uniref:nuclear transport factor 2 family protein n=1 Tax=Reyranella sp. TaxID=1929291 RepID=UPI001209E377|nr:nuclear transport factor 2 family protein [Reyranella sp.]TAJ35672.1 MAG: nuclear transport factor 2 family protein [Reyranella sp.]
MSTATATAQAASPAAITGSVDTTIDTYVATWNETDPLRRRAGIAAAWVEAATYRDPVMASDGPAGIDAMLAGVQAKFPGFVLKRTSRVDAHNGTCRFTWSLGPAAGPSVVEGVDFCALAPDGRLASVVGFIDKAPS